MRVRELRKLSVVRDGDEVTFDVEATAFLKHMAAILWARWWRWARGGAPSRPSPSFSPRGIGRSPARPRRRGCLCLIQVFYEGHGEGTFPAPKTPAASGCSA